MGSMMTKRAYFEANIFITAFESNLAVREDARMLLEEAESNQSIVTFTSELTLAEILVKPLRDKNSQLVSKYKEMISNSGLFRVVPISRRVLVRASELRYEYNSLKLPDAIHVATAQLSQCHFFVSNDLRLPLPAEIIKISLDSSGLDRILMESQ
jgi:predicted nucleic acid-binding protein